MVVVAINRAVRPPMVMMPRMEAQRSVYATNGTANGTPDDSTNRTGSAASLGGAPLHSSENALRMNCGRRGKQSRYRGKPQHLQHVVLQSFKAL